jgi:hypothetical protein
MPSDRSPDGRRNRSQAFGSDEWQHGGKIVCVIDEYFRSLFIREDPRDVGSGIWTFFAEVALGNRSIHTLDLRNRTIHAGARGGQGEVA